MSSTTAVSSLLVARPRGRALLDIAIATAALAGVLAQLSHDGIGPLLPGPIFDGSRVGHESLDPVGIVLAAGSAVPLIAWRRSPLPVFVVTAAASVLLVALGYPLDLMLGPAVALYLLAASGEQHTPWTRRTTVTVVGLFVAYLVAATAAQQAFPGSAFLHSGLTLAVAWFAGERARLRREHIAQLRVRAVSAERDAERERLLAGAEERARIARDLHDSAGHAISVIAVRAGAARLRHDQEPDRSRVALAEIEELARQTADEIDQIVGALREGGPVNGARAVEAPPGLAALDTLIAHHATAGLEVTLDASGAPPPRGDPADQAAYRILQEALTNAARHGAGRARIELDLRDLGVELTVTNPVPATGAARSGGGHGLTGMRERATLLGGSLDTERANGMFRVHARIPYGGHRR